MKVAPSRSLCGPQIVLWNCLKVLEAPLNGSGQHSDTVHWRVQPLRASEPSSSSQVRRVPPPPKKKTTHGFEYSLFSLFADISLYFYVTKKNT